jgi:hemolysin III
MYPGERFNSITHLAGSLIALGGAVALVFVAAGGDGRRLTALSIYGASLFILYLSSTMYHSLRGPAKRVFHVLDHCSIYILIAGTYTPLTLVTLRGVWGWSLFAVIWLLAVIGIIKDALFHGRFRVVSVLLYVAMGWLAVVAFGPLRQALPPEAITWLIAGGIVYTAGIAFFAMSRRVPYTHGIWHLFAIGGSVCHYVMIWQFIARAPVLSAS